MGFVILILLVVAAVAAYRFRAPLLARILGQDQGRIERQLKQRRRD